MHKLGKSKLGKPKLRKSKLSLLLVDNYDSFTFNLQHMFLLFPEVRLTVKRNDDDLIGLIEQNSFDGVIIGPGPGSPEDEQYFGFNRRIILDYGTAGLPVFGVCLGFQGIYHAFGGSLALSPVPMHGKTSPLCIAESGGTILRGVADDVQVMRYHSIIADLTRPVPDCFRLVAYAADAKDAGKEAVKETTKELMAIEHKQYPIFGVQFHPESFATECGMQIARNFVGCL